MPISRIGNRTVEQLQAAARGGGVSLWQAACANLQSGRSGASIATFVRLIDNMRAATQGLPLPEVIEHVIEASGLVAYYKTEKEGAERVENLSELVNAGTAFAAEEGLLLHSADAPSQEGVATPTESSPLDAFLAHAALEAGEHQAAAGADGLQLMTVHSAKGLEFHSVFISGLEEGLFPHENSLGEDGGLEEERRLMYVAITRARRRLYLSHAQTRMLHGQIRYNIASRFLDEIPAELMKRVNTVAAAPAP